MLHVVLCTATPSSSVAFTEQSKVNQVFPEGTQAATAGSCRSMSVAVKHAWRSSIWWRLRSTAQEQHEIDPQRNLEIIVSYCKCMQQVKLTVCVKMF